jgi:hypothetical protein
MLELLEMVSRIASVMMYGCWALRLRPYQSAQPEVRRRERYILTTIAWGFMPLALLNDPIHAVMTVMGDSDKPTWQSMIGFAADAYVVWDLWTSNDDNWWRRKRKKIRSWVHNRLSVRKLAPGRVSV